MRFPGESDQYRAARDELLQAEIQLRRQTEAVAAQRRTLPLGGELAEDYELSEWNPGTGAPRGVRFSELFAPGKDTLFVYSFMWNPGPSGEPLQVPCPVCTSVIDSVDGSVRHASQAINFAVMAKVPIERFQAHAFTRGWRNVRLLSSAGTTYNRDYGTEGDDANQFPIATVFVKRDGKIHHFWSSELWDADPEPGQHARHVDFMWPMWAVLDSTPAGRADFMPTLDY